MSTQIDLLKKYGLPIQGFSGQHLLIDANIQKKIVEALSIEPDDWVLEIGPGLGALTEEILKKGCKLWVIEKDPRFVEVLQGELGVDYKDQLTILKGDVLEFSFDRLKKIGKSKKWKIISNLPYYITAPILFHMIESRSLFSEAVIMMQKEVARRLNAAPSTKDYGRLTLGVRYSADVEYLFDVSRGCFTPKPKVDSAVIKLKFHTESKMPRGVDEEFIFHLIKLAFSQRRKTLLNLMVKDAGVGMTREEVSKLFQDHGLKENVRGENLLLKDYLALAETIKSRKPL